MRLRVFLWTNLVIYCLIVPFISKAQDNQITRELANYAYRFRMQHGKLSGKGYEYLKNKIDNHQFVLLGENHSSSKLSQLLAILIPELSEKGFQHLALEVGPISALRLQSYQSKADIQQALIDLNRKFYNGRYPIPFFTTKEDAQFLAAALNQNWKLWGLDQEYNNGNEFLFDELFSTIKDEVKQEQIKPLKEAAVRRIAEIKRTDDKPECTFLTDTIIGSYFVAFESGNTRALEIIDATRKSWKIYCSYAEKKYKENNEERAKYMIQNFMMNYNISLGSGQHLPKVFIKLGHGHVTIGKSPLGVEDVGMMAHQLAIKNGTKCLHIAQRQRYVKGKLGLRQDYMKYSKDIAPILKLARKKEWVVIDLGEFKKNKSDIILTKGVQKEIERYDILLLTPTDKRGRKAR